MKKFLETPDLLIKHGSHLFGCATPESDVDLRGFVIEPGEYLLDRPLDGRFEQHEVNDETGDIVIYGIRKFFALLEKGAPNAIEILFAKEDDILSATEAGRTVIENRHLFLSHKLIKAIGGFAESEWRKAQLLHKNKNTGEIRSSTRVVGARRKETYEKFGYCTKNAYHAIRLLQEGVEIMLDGHISFPRPNVEELQDIRNGTISFEDLKKKYETLLALFFEVEEDCFENNDNPPFPREVDRRAINELYFDLVRENVLTLLGDK